MQTEKRRFSDKAIDFVLDSLIAFGDLYATKVKGEHKHSFAHTDSIHEEYSEEVLEGVRTTWTQERKVYQCLGCEGYTLYPDEYSPDVYFGKLENIMKSQNPQEWSF